ncbi:MAG: TetR/AcrR family transcriptional regulator; helix-turn-helix transcriptional regulator [Deltaproteobacteria bacterium]|nr:TetR/AcrR family transcriptional regulator; helix-turn-helix transcriptional regulator [Deltaproteobacteria bacterium]
MSEKTTLEKLREEERETRRNLIIDAAIRLFARAPFNQVGVRDIAAEAGMSPASLYRYFADRDEMFLEALLRESRSLSTRLAAPPAADETSGLAWAARVFVEHLLDRDAFFQMMTYFMVGGGIRSAAVARFNQIQRDLVDRFEELFRASGRGDNSRLGAHGFLSSLNGILITFRNYPGRTREEARRHMLRLADLTARAFAAPDACRLP